MKKNSIIKRITAIGIALLAGGAISQAASDSWTGATDGTWATGGNWLGGNVPGTGDTATFNATSGNATINLGAGVTVSNLLFDTASASPYIIGSGAAGSQTLTLVQANGGITLSPTVTANQTLNANMALATTGNYNIVNNSAKTLTLAGTNSTTSAGIKVVTVDGTGTNIISGPIVSGTGTMNLQKTNSGTLILSGGATWSGGGVNEYLVGSTLVPAVLRAGSTIITSGNYTNNGEFTLGGLIANGGAGNNAKLIMNGGLLVMPSGNWFSVGRGNGIGGVSSDVVLNNNAAIITPNTSLGFNPGTTANQAKGTLTLNNNSAYNANGNFYIAESAGQDMTLTVNDAAGVTNVSSAGIRVSSSGKGNLVVNGGTVRTEGDLTISYSSALPNKGSVLVNGGNLHVATTTKRWLLVGRSGTGGSDMVVSNGAVFINANTDIRFSTTAGATGTNTLTMRGGSITFYSDNATTVGGSGVVDLQQNGTAATYNTFNLDGGTLTVPGILSAAATGTRIFNFNGGTLKPTASSTTFINLGAGNAFAKVRNGGAVIDSNGKDLVIPQVLMHSDIAGDNAVDGGLTKTGNGSLTLGSGNTYTGPTKVLGGTLNLAPGLLPAGNLVISNATVNFTNTGSSVLVNALNLQSNAVLNLIFGTLSGNPSVATVAASGALTTSGTNTINISGSGFALGQFPLISYVGTPLASLGNIKLGVMPAGITATLVNNTANNTIDLNISLIGQTLIWYGGVSANWDINTTLNWNSGANKYLEYGTTNLFGDFAVFDDSLINQLNTNVNLTAALHSAQITVNSSLPYSFTGAGSLAGSGYLTMSGSGSLTLGTANSYSGGTFLNAGTLVLSNSAALGTGALTITGGTLDSLVANLVNANNNAQNWNGAFTFAGTQNLNLGTGAVTLTANSTLTINTNTLTVGGPISGGYTLTKDGNGVLALTGNNPLTGNTIVNQGVLTLSGSGAFSALTDLYVGNVAGQAGAIYQSGSTIVTNSDVGGGAFQIGRLAGAAGYYKLTGGTINLAGEINIGGFSGGAGTFGQLDILGGTINLPNRSAGTYFLINRSFTAGETAVVNILGGTVKVAGDGLPTTTGLNGLALNWLSSGTHTATVTIGAGGQIVTPSITTKLNMGINYNGLTGSSGNVADLNLNSGGLLQTLGFLNGVGNNPNVRVNFNGGTVKAGSAANTAFLQDLGGVYIYGGGGTIDDNGQAITIAQPFLAPADSGVSAIAVADAGLGYTAPPQVIISGDGVGATAYATIDPVTGAVTGIVVTCPGTGYTTAPTVTLTGIGNTVAATAGTVTMAANIVGSLTKVGTGTLTLSGMNGFTGSTLVNTGTLVLTAVHQSTGSYTVANGAKLGIATSSLTNGATIGDLNFSAGASTLSFAYGLAGNPTNVALTAGAVTISGTATISLGGDFAVGTFPLLKYTSLSGAFSSTLQLPRGVTATLSNSVATSTLYVVVTAAGGGIVWSGTDALTPNLWDINLSTNWLTGTTPTTYLQTLVPGDSVTFNDTGSGSVNLNTNVSPAKVVINNSSVNYTFNGSGYIAGTASLTKSGTGTATLNLAGNSFTGGTVVSNGTLQVGALNAAGTNNMLIAPTGRLDLNGNNQTVNGLTLNGVIDNSSGTAAILTMGGNSGAVVWNGAITNTGAGGISFIKNSTNGGTVTIKTVNYFASAAASQFNGDTLVITNGGALIMSGAAEFWVCQSNAISPSATVIVDGGTLVTSNNWLVVGRSTIAANGTLTVNNGTVRKAGATGNIVVGSLGATGTLNVNGGQILNSSMLWLGEGSTAVATLNLNGGLIQATQVRANNSGGLPSVGNAVANFNGGTLQATANSTNFIDATISPMVGAGGLVLDDGGFTLVINQALQDNGGGLIKKGTGTVYLDGANTYSGPTVVTNGTLTGIGSLNGPVVVGPAGNIGAGNTNGVGILTLNSQPLTINNGKASLRIAKNGGTPTSDLISGITTATYGGTLVISNATTDATPLAVGDTFTLFSAGTHSGYFTNIVGTPGTGLGYAFTNGMLTVVTGIATNPTNITFSVTGSTLHLSWPTDHLGWTLQQQTNSLTQGLGTNWVDVAGSTGMTSTNITVDPTKPTVFYRLKY